MKNIRKCRKRKFEQRKEYREKYKGLSVDSSVRRLCENSTGYNHGQLPAVRQLRRVSTSEKQIRIHREGVQCHGEFRNRQGQR